MTAFREKYVNPFTDYGFKRLFGEESSKDLLLDFLNELLKKQEGKITEIDYYNNENLGSTELSRRAIFDLYCKNNKGERFIVELQKTKQNYFKDITVYYSTFPIQEQAQKGSNWDFELKNVYTIAILDFVFDEDKYQKDKYQYDVKLTEQETKTVFYDKLTFVYISMPKFNKEIEDLETRLDKWLYVIKNLHILKEIPKILIEDSIFKKLFEVAEIANFTEKEFFVYHSNLKQYRDLNNSFNTATDTGRKEGMEKGIEIGKKEGRKEGIEKGKKELITQNIIGLYKMGLAKEKIAEGLEISINKVDEVFIEKVLTIIEKNISDSNFSVVDFSSNIGMSHSVLYRKILAITGQTITEFIKSIRLTKAKELFLKSNYSLNKISDMTGFSNPSYFSTSFKKKYGMTPSNYKKQA